MDAGRVMSPSVGVPLFGLAVVLFAAASFRLPVLRMPSWPHVGVTLLCMGTALIVGPISVSIPDRGPLAVVRMVLIFASAALVFVGLLSLVWIPRRLQDVLSSWDSHASQPWLYRHDDGEDENEIEIEK